MSQFESDRLSALLNDKASINELKDQKLDCIDCKNHFVWSTGEQTFFRDKGLQNPPKRCKTCKQAKTQRIESVLAAQAEGVKQKIEVIVDCAECGEVTTVPFYPSQGRPVYCRSCFIRQNPSILKPEKPENENSNGNHKK